MLCEKCKKNEAKINLVKIVNKEKHEIWLCENCAKDISNIPFLSFIGKETDIPIQGILTELLSNIGNSEIESSKIVCNNCGLTYEDFKKSGKLGCATCYEEFFDIIEPIIKKIQDGITYVGKIPKTNEKEIIQRHELKDLKAQLQKLIVSEEYEQAAIVRDNIRDLELSIQEENIEEKEFNIRGGKV